MAKKIKFALEMKNGVKVRSSIEELRENFDIDLAAQYFLDGKLITWLEDRFYEEEADKLRAVDKNSANLKQELCNILGVDFSDESGMDIEQLERLNEKKKFLQEKTDDIKIIANADKTAFNQVDLAELLEAGHTTIYLCGEKFSIPLKVEDVTYIGILGTPSLKVATSSQVDLDKRNISVENAKLPWDKEETSAYKADIIVPSASSEIESSSSGKTPAPPLSSPTNTVKGKAEALLQKIKDNSSYLTEWSYIPYPYLAEMDIFADSRSEMKISIRNAASGYENELRWGLQDIVNEKTAILQDIQTAYEELFQISNRSYIPSSPTLQEVLQAMSKGVNMFSSSLGGFADKLVSMAQIDSSHTIGHFSDLFKTDCSLENWDELSSYANDYYDKLCAQLEHSDFNNCLGTYLSSITRATERLAK